MIYFDLDGVIRNLVGDLVNGEEITSWDQQMSNGQSFCDYIDDHMEVLLTATPTAYHPVISHLHHIDIMTKQPLSWRPWTEKWIYNHFDPGFVNIIYVENIEDKIPLLKDGDILVEDYPKFDDYSKIIVIDHPYNRNVKNCIERITDPERLKVLLEERR